MESKKTKIKACKFPRGKKRGFSFWSRAAAIVLRFAFHSMARDAS